MEQKSEYAELKKMLLEFREQSAKNEVKFKSDLSEIKSLAEKMATPMPCPELRRDWMPRDELKKYLQFGDTQMSFITKKYGLTYTEIGKRKLYSISSLQKILDSNKIN